MSRFGPGWIPAVAATLAVALSGCSSIAGEAAGDGRIAAAPLSVAPPPPRPADLMVVPVSFAEWRSGFRMRALAAGITAATFDDAFRDIAVNDRVLELDDHQPEFTRPIWDYLDGAVSLKRIASGSVQAQTKAALLRAIESRYGVDYPILLAIWGLESGFGANFGKIPVIESLATLAYDGRRKAWAEEQLVAALNILQAGDISPERMVGSWAGAMGHTQFIPTSFLSYAVDHNGDGRRDIWAVGAVDALASTANYLSHFGWTRGAPTVVEVRLGGGFDYASAGAGTRRSAAQWLAAGVAPVSGALPPGDDLAILLPAGASGPAFAVYPNFRVIKRYNNATSYALAVAHLAQRITGAPSFTGAWPRDDRPLSRTQKQDLQERLTALGYDTQGADGIIGPNSRAAIRGFQAARGLIPDGYVSVALLDAVRAAGG